MSYTRPHERPSCPQGHGPEHVNSAGPTHWMCFLCNPKRFPKATAPDPTTSRTPWKHTNCPQCGSDNIEREDSGTWVCWSCDWFDD